MRLLYIAIAAILLIDPAVAQNNVGIGTATPAASALLDMTSTSKGLLLPRMNITQRNAISSPATGLMIWCTNCAPAGEVEVFNGNAWTTVGNNTSGLPSVTTTEVSGIGNIGATTGGNVTSNGGSDLAFRGICWSTTPNPTVALSTKTMDGQETGMFVSFISGLSGGVTYHVRAYAINAAGTGYGNDIMFTTVPLVSIGQSYLGGIVAYNLQSGDPGYDANLQHGLIAAPTDQNTNSEWGCFGTNIGTNVYIGTGNQNTTNIVNGCSTAGIAARICSDLVLGGYSDWYLPSVIELTKLYENRVAIGGFDTNNNNYYWSSSQWDMFQAYQIYFTNGFESFTYKGIGRFVRAIRSF